MCLWDLKINWHYLTTTQNRCVVILKIKHFNFTVSFCGREQTEPTNCTGRNRWKKSGEEVSNPTGLRHSWGPSCERVRWHVYTHVLTSAFNCVWVNAFCEWIWHCSILGCVCVFACVRHGKQEEEGKCKELWRVFDGGVEPPRRHNGNADVPN